MWKNSLRNVESDNNKILYGTLLVFLQRNGTYFVNKPRVYSVYIYVHIYTLIMIIKYTLSNKLIIAVSINTYTVHIKLADMSYTCIDYTL